MKICGPVQSCLELAFAQQHQPKMGGNQRYAPFGKTFVSLPGERAPSAGGILEQATGVLGTGRIVPGLVL